MQFEPIPCADCGALDSFETQRIDHPVNTGSITYCRECGEVQAVDVSPRGF